MRLLAIEHLHLPDKPAIFWGQLIFNWRGCDDAVESFWVAATAVSPCF
jgi:hypothetical protein